MRTLLIMAAAIFSVVALGIANNDTEQAQYEKHALEYAHPAKWAELTKKLGDKNEIHGNRRARDSVN